MTSKPYIRIEDRIYPRERVSFGIAQGSVSIFIFIEGDGQAIASYSGENAARLRAWLRDHTEELDLVDDRYAALMKGYERWQ